MSNNYSFDDVSLQDIAEFSVSTVTELQDIVKKAESLKGKIKSYSGWQGKQKEELITFLDLLIPYHKDLVQKKDCPFIQYQDSLKALRDHLDSYPGNAKSYKELKIK